MRSKLLLGLTLLGLLWIFAGEAPRPAQACSSPTVTIEWMVNDFETTVVVGRFIELDSTQHNGLFEVRQYLTGDADAKFLVVMGAAPELLAQKYNGADTLCSAFTRLGPEGHEAVVFLTRNDDGSYQPFGFDRYVFSASESTQEVPIRFDDDARDYIIEDLTLDEMLGEISEISGEAPREPSSDVQQPFLAPLMIMTDQNAAYMLPVDGGDPVLLAQDYDSYQVSGRRIMFIHDDEVRVRFRDTLTYSNGELADLIAPLVDCPEQNCAAISPRGTYAANFIPGGNLVVIDGAASDPSMTYEEARDVRRTYLLRGPVYGFRFSPEDNMLAVWRENSIEVFALSHAVSQALGLTLVNDIQTSDGLLPDGIWSADERHLVFTDEDGL